MKKLLILAITAALYFPANSQVFMKTGGGYAFPLNKPIVELGVGGLFFQEKGLIQIGYQTHMGNLVDGGALFQFRVGMQLNSENRLTFIPQIGIANHYKSSDKPELNRSYPLYAIDVDYRTNIDQLRIYAGGTYSGKRALLSAGIRFLFVNYSNKSCKS